MIKNWRTPRDQPIPPTDPIQPPNQDIEASTENSQARIQETDIRRGFIKKVYLILTAQILVTTFIVIILSATKVTNRFVNPDGT